MVAGSEQPCLARTSARVPATHDAGVASSQARWEWKHGISVSEAHDEARRAIVWRLLVDDAT